jgi:transposase-like protein
MVEDFPKAAMDFERRFATDEACRDYLRALRWPSGFICPRCDGRSGWQASRMRWVCGKCRHQTSITAGTIFQDSHLPLTVWFRAMWYVTSQKNGASALAVQRLLGLGSYKTAWALLHKLRRAMVRPGRDQLTGQVEVDETFVGGEESGREGRGALTKALVVIAAEENGRGIGRIRMARIPNAAKPVLHGFIQQVVAPCSTVHTDGWASYRGLDAHGYGHRVTALKGQPADAAITAMPRVHRVASLLKRWLLGTHQGAVGVDHLDYYLDEFTFRFNRRNSASRGKLFYRLAQQAVQIAPVPFDCLLKPQPLGVGGVK